MKQSGQNRRYLLGAMPADERAAWEDRYFADDDVFEELVDAENDLIDAYVRGRLSNDERQPFEDCYCNSPEGLARVKFAEALRETRAGRRAPVGAWTKPSWATMLAFLPAPRSFAWAAGITVMIAAGCAWLMVENHRLRNELQIAKVTQMAARQGEQGPQGRAADTRHALEPNTEGHGAGVAKLRGPESAIAILTLTPGVIRSGGEPQQTLVLSLNKSWVRLQLSVAVEYGKYQADLQTVEGQEIVHIGASDIQTNRDRGLVVLLVPANVIGPGDYVVRLSGIGNNRKPEDVEFYSFRAKRQEAQ
ncbi:MAG: hypothetical protein LAQ69_23855 [Acidobacteriia bacterium]|nr:hypothetical protein [Terriglobia bacterium]